MTQLVAYRSFKPRVPGSSPGASTQANVIMRREETASTPSLLNTAKLMEDNDMLYKLKEMEYVERIAEKIGEITIAGNDGVEKQLKEIFATSK